MKSVSVNGREVAAMEHECQIEQEGWSRYLLDDGTRFRLKVNLNRVYRAYNADGVPEVDEHGDPVLIVTHDLQVVVKVSQ